MLGDYKLKPESAKETEEAQTPQGMRKRLRQYARDDALTRNVWMMAQHHGLSGEDEMTVLAYNALVQLEALREQLLDEARRYPGPYFVPSENS